MTFDVQPHETHGEGTDAPSWQKELLESFTSVDELETAGILTTEEAAGARASGERFRVRVPRYYAQLMDRSPEGRAHCPIRAQALPGLGEQDPPLPDWARRLSVRAFGRAEPWLDDAIGDLAKLAAPRLTHRYGNRAIVHLSSLCALYCRFCFRKSHLNDDERTLYDGSLEPALEYVGSHDEITEVILTGGDPLSLPDRWLERFLGRLGQLKHIRHVRLHSRMAATMPSRLTPELAQILANVPFQVALVSHFNHARELTRMSLSRLESFRKQGIALYNQSVLLRAVNDQAETLRELFQGLYNHGVRPFYLHHPDWTPGTFSFRLPIERGQQIMDELAGTLSGPALPHYVLDIPGGQGKVALTGQAVACLERKSGDGLGGALYRVTPPRTRSSGREPILYAELWKLAAE